MLRSTGKPLMSTTRGRSPDQEITPAAVHHSEGGVAWTIEDQTAKLPSEVFLRGAGASNFAAMALNLNGRTHDALFVGQ